MSTLAINDVVNRIADNYESELIFFTDAERPIPSSEETIEIIRLVQNLIFPGYFEDEQLHGAELELTIAEKLLRIHRILHKQVHSALCFNKNPEIAADELLDKAEGIAGRFIEQLPTIQSLLFKDAQAAFDGDPAAQSKEEIIFAYPGLFAIFVYRIAHILYEEKVPLLPRIMTEYAHGRTGVDINAGAQIGEYFFIDHATGVVIGETTTIGNHVKIYQGVTLGALSTRAGQKLAGVKRHPTIEDNVIIYSNASILGGETVIGEGSIIGGSAFVTQSIPAGARVGVKNQEVNIKLPKQEPAWAQSS